MNLPSFGFALRLGTFALGISDVAERGPTGTRERWTTTTLGLRLFGLNTGLAVIGRSDVTLSFSGSISRLVITGAFRKTRQIRGPQTYPHLGIQFLVSSGIGLQYLINHVPDSQSIALRIMF